MRIMLLVLFLLIIQTVSLDFRNGLFDRDKRANPSNEPPPIKQILERHLPLGRVFNALYLQIELADKKIDGLDVVAGVFNLKDKTSLEKLVSLKFGGLAEELKTLDEAVKKVPDGIGEIVDVDLINEKYKVVLGIDENKRKAMLRATHEDLAPHIAKSGGDSKVLINLKENLAEKVLEKMGQTANLKEFPRNLIEDLKETISNCVSTITGLPAVLRILMIVSSTNLDPLITGAKLANEVHSKSEDIGILHNSFAHASTELVKLEALSSPKKIRGLKQRLAQVQSGLNNVHLTPPGFSIAAAFISNQSLSQIFDDIKNPWLKSVLNEGGDLKQLSQTLEKFREISSSVENLAKSSMIFDKKQSTSLLISSDIVNHVETYQFFSDKIKLDQLLSCLNMPKTAIPIPLKDLEKLSDKLKSFHASLTSLDTTWKNIAILDADIKKMEDGYLRLGRIYSLSSVEEWRKTSEFSELEKIFQKLIPTFDSLKQDYSFIDFVRKLDGMGSKVEKVQKWISEIQFLKLECEILLKLNVEKLSQLNQIPGDISNIKKTDHISKLQSFIESIPKIQTDVESFKVLFASDNSKLPIRNPFAEVTNLQRNKMSLLEVAFATRSLELMSKFEEMGVDLHMVFNRGDLVMSYAKKIKSLERKKLVEDAWKDFPAFKKDLEEFQKTNKKLVSSLKSTPEKNLEEVGKVYKDLEVFKFSRQKELRKMRETLRFLDHLQPDLEKALENLEEPLSLDWGLVHANFKRIQRVLPDLQKNFMQFFAGDDEKESGGKDENDNIDLILFAGIGAGALLLLAFFVCCILYYMLIYDVDMKNVAPVEKNYTPPPEEDFQYTYMQLQDARLEINQIDVQGITPLLRAVKNSDWKRAELLIQSGAIPHPCCNGPFFTTPLHQLVQTKNQKYSAILWLCGASEKICDWNGDNVLAMAETTNFSGQYVVHDIKPREPPFRILPPVPRYWKVLVFDKKCFKFYKKKRLPKRIKKHITWGYTQGMDLNQFSHIVVPNEYLLDGETLKLDDKDLMTFKLYGCWANLMGVDWLNAMADKKIHEMAMDMDYEFYVKNTWYKGSHHEMTVVELKTGIHQLQPKLLSNVSIVILNTNDDLRKSQRNQIENLIEQFGGEVKTEVEFDAHDGLRPYYAFARDDEKEDRNERDKRDNFFQNCLWILKYPDSEVRSSWKRKPHQCTVSDIQLLFESIARWRILPFTNNIVKPEYNAPVKKRRHRRV